MELSSQQRCDLGFIGLGVMGKNLVLNLVDNGYQVAGFDLDPDKVQQTIKQSAIEHPQFADHITGCASFTELLAQTKSPRIIVLSVPAGNAVDQVCDSLIRAGIQADDIVIDTGNSLWTDTVTREQRYKDNFILFSSAVSGGEVGARFGPALMPSGSAYAWSRIKPIWQAIAAKVDGTTGKPIERSAPGQSGNLGEPCAAYIGPSGSGHYVKMVHNGIEYADMQLICEVYHVLKSSLQLSNQAIADIFEQWNQGVLESYLLEITVEVLRHSVTIEQQQVDLVDLILDKAGQKGTGLWTAMSALELGCPAPTIAQAVFARSISSFKDFRIKASQVFITDSEPKLQLFDEPQDFIDALHDALYCAKICAYAQGFQLMALAAKEYHWQLDFAAIANIWRAGCIIRAVFLQSINDAYKQQPELDNLMVDEFFAAQLRTKQQAWSNAVAQANLQGIPVAALSSALNYFNAMRSETLPANLLQGQRDYFGAHTFTRVDKPAHEKYHVNWSEPKREIVKI